jgi:hypothetical protein
VGRTRYTALDEHPGHEMKPLLSSRYPQSLCPLPRRQDWLHCSLNGDDQLPAAHVRRQTSS